MSHGCPALVPAWLCKHADILVYLMPVAALAFLIRIVAAVHPIFFIFTVAGTLCHELAHFFVGLLSNAQPVGLTIIPRRVGRTGWELGSVTFANLRWYNAAPAALAPLLVLALPVSAAWWRTRGLWHYEPVDLALAFLLAPQLLSFWPSPVDWRLARRSWPWAILLILTVLVWMNFRLLEAALQ